MENIIREKSYKFALRIVNLHKYLVETKKEFVLSKQILRSGTSIGANVEEAIGGQTKKDFCHKIFLAYKEARETHYWIRLLRDSNYIDIRMYESILPECNEIIKITGKIISTSRKSL
jgi:four helix bundle protein